MKNILIIYYSQGGSTKKMAHTIALGVEATGAEAMIRTVPNISANIEKTEPSIPESGDLFATKEDLANCDGLIVGSPAYFGNMASPLKHFLEKHSDLWFKGNLIDKPVGFFTAASGMHAGHESTLLSMMIPFMHHGCLIVGIPYSEQALEHTRTGGTPYGASHLNTFSANKTLSDDEIRICKTLGRRVATIASRLSI
ncbi:NAD(P)H dehydrogenase (quinone) [Allofrancisella inopinata]|uniref:NAD(P)H:quinone oxidoreductase n=1 Tax=Allofrancisella inopinata TaxID=1085647 RepID=A0AAE6YKR1_9GAMM|nr:NAD(P)H:quinone oxidoreductase [Allofrancisella inopinata]QIV96649.1 NAD(P)H:quinone oxidoreductase [Allofrancisella inopinata]TDT67391.1 NAD(P)H dehydrogenase (quinone) [Allofrancisella inopinata]